MKRPDWADELPYEPELDDPVDGGVSERRMNWLLGNWGDWMRQGGTPERGYPTRSIGMHSTGANAFDELVRDVDIKLARVLDAVIDSLSHDQRSAVCNRHLASVWRLRRPQEDVYAEARIEVRMILKRRRVD